MVDRLTTCCLSIHEDGEKEGCRPTLTLVPLFSSEYSRTDISFIIPCLSLIIHQCCCSDTWFISNQSFTPLHQDKHWSIDLCDECAAAKPVANIWPWHHLKWMTHDVLHESQPGASTQTTDKTNSTQIWGCCARTKTPGPPWRKDNKTVVTPWRRVKLLVSWEGWQLACEHWEKNRTSMKSCRKPSHCIIQMSQQATNAKLSVRYLFPVVVYRCECGCLRREAGCWK